MGKRKETTTVAPKKQKSMTKWEELYSELDSRVAEALRGARVKPEQLVTMADGEIMAIDGINETGLEEIRKFYAADIQVAEAESGTDQTGPELAEGQIVDVAGPKPANKRHLFKNGKKITTMTAKIDRTKNYEIEEAVKLVKTTNITSFDATVTLHLNLREQMSRVELTFPFVAGAAKKVAIVTDELLKDIEKGKIDFDILLTTPAFMPKLAKYAKVLGPKGLMPSPKAGTITPDPEKKAKEFVAGKTVVKAEPKFPLMHVTVGKVSQKSDELVANIKALLEAVKVKNIWKATLASTMSPGIKISLS